ncbi:MAG: protein-glutamate O-methyltransferase [Coriobacteriia bacterium]
MLLDGVEPANPGNIDRLLRKIGEERGLDLGQYRRSYVERRIATRMRAVGCRTYMRYARYLDEHPEEWHKLLDTLTINVTEFFRDPEVYEEFARTVVPSLLAEKERRRQRMVRVWSAGCATGQEPYSIAMSVLWAMKGWREHFYLNVLATDLDPEALRKAKEAHYPREQLASIPPKYRTRFVEPTADGFRLTREVTDVVRFRQLNLFEDDPIHVVDVIFCRNVFIYFTREQQMRVLEKFWSSLHRGGYLVLGRSEKLSGETAQRLELVNARLRIYRKP